MVQMEFTNGHLKMTHFNCKSCRSIPIQYSSQLVYQPDIAVLKFKHFVHEDSLKLRKLKGFN